MAELCDDLCAALAQTGATTSDFALNPDIELPAGRKLRSAGVLVGIADNFSAPQVFLTKRSSVLKHHPGQIAFPGGKQDESDADVIATALREAREEIGLKPKQVEVLGCLPAHETVTGFTVTPVLARISADFRPVADPGEVTEVFTVPLRHITDTANFSVQSRRWQGIQRSYDTVPYGPYYIWGATARILRGLAERMKVTCN